VSPRRRPSNELEEERDELGERDELAEADEEVERGPGPVLAPGAEDDRLDDEALEVLPTDTPAADELPTGELAADELTTDEESTAEGEAETEQFEVPEMLSQMLFVDVVLLLPATHPVVVLQEADPPYREVRIPVGGAEGIAIGYAARGLTTPRPLTHELMTNILEQFGLTLEMVRVTSVRGSAFKAEMVISGRSGSQVVDCRPSDAIALALRQKVPVPIMATPEVLVRAGTDPAGAN
jgi:uncharacterized protein